jgi:hypothetical protein
MVEPLMGLDDCEMLQIRDFLEVVGEQLGTERLDSIDSWHNSGASGGSRAFVEMGDSSSFHKTDYLWDDKPQLGYIVAMELFDLILDEIG